MDKIVGKLWYVGVMILCVMGTLHKACAIQMHVVSIDDMPIEQVGVGRPFKLKVTVEGQGAHGARPEINGMEHAQMQHAGLFMKTVNGYATTTYTYQVRIDTEGTYTLGPAVVRQGNNMLRSNTVSVSVGEQESLQQKNEQHQQKDAVAFIRLFADKEQLVVGEPIRCFMRLYAQDGGRITHVDEPDLSGWQKRGTSQQTKGTDRINGQDYPYVEWCWDMIPTTSGMRLVPACRAELQESQPHDDAPGLGGFFSSFLSMHNKTRRLYSNALTVPVQELPAHDGPVHAIGSLTHADMTVEPMHATVGEGVVVKIRLEGDADFAGMTDVPLQQMPGGIKWYASKQYMTNAWYTGPKAKIFEYIVQGFQPGTYIIPGQLYTVFDVTKRTYTHVYTESVSLDIAQVPEQNRRSETSQAGDTMPETAIDTSAEVVEDNPLAPCNESGPWYPVSHAALPVWVLLVMTSIPFISCAVRLFRTRFLCWWLYSRPSRRKKQAVYRTLSALERIRHEGDIAGIYPLIIQFFALRLQQSESVITASYIAHKLERAGMQPQLVEEWQNFFQTVQAACFGHMHVSKREKNQMFDETRTWIEHIVRYT